MKNEILVCRFHVQRIEIFTLFFLESSLSYMGEVIHRIEEARDTLVRKF